MIARWIVAVFGLFVAAVGIWVLIEPGGLVAFADLFLTPGGLWFAVGLRLIVGILLWVAAPGSRTPMVLRVLGGLFVLSAFALPFVGLDRMVGVAQWGAERGDLVLRSVGLFTGALGAFIAWSVLPRRNEG